MSRKIVNFSNHTKIEKIAKPNFLDGAFFPLFFLAVQIFLQSTCGNRRWISASGKKYKSNLITFSAPRGCGKAPPGSPFLHRSVPQLFRPYGNSQWTCTLFPNSCTSTQSDSKRLKHAPPFPPFNDEEKKLRERKIKSDDLTTKNDHSYFIFLAFLSLSGGMGVPRGAVEFFSKKKACTSLRMTEGKNM